ncbi:hypothetical protein [Priestia megaterium]|uniref:hypothetical protein n=1 Tax=Priestia megaterium TaxID=1404 RepID=UPI003008C25B
MNHKKSNYQIAISSLTNARHDHYDGVNAIYRLSAYAKIPESTCKDGFERQLQKIMKNLSSLSVYPNRIYVQDDKLEIDWYPKGYQMVMNRGQYAGLLLEFAEFLNKANMRDLVIQDGFFGDDPEESVKSMSNDMINFFPEFNSDCFGLRDNNSIEIMYC